MTQIATKNFNSPDTVMTPPKSKMEIVTLNGKTAMRMTFEPGWKWSVDIHPDSGTELCQMHHFGYVISGVLHVQGTDGAEVDAKAGDILDIPPGHDAWVVGNEPVVFIDFGALR